MFWNWDKAQENKQYHVGDAVWFGNPDNPIKCSISGVYQRAGEIRYDLEYMVQQGVYLVHITGVDPSYMWKAA